MIEKLFQVQRRQAISIMSEIGPVDVAGRFHVLRSSLLSWVQNIQETEGQELERRRVGCDLDQKLAEAHAARRALRDVGRPPQEFALPKEMLSASLDSLPREISIAPGRITVCFNQEEPESALELLYLLSLALANDFDVFLSRNTSIHTPIHT